jgi:hypothetical protein
VGCSRLGQRPHLAAHRAAGRSARSLLLRFRKLADHALNSREQRVQLSHRRVIQGRPERSSGFEPREHHGCTTEAGKGRASAPDARSRTQSRSSPGQAMSGGHDPTPAPTETQSGLGRRPETRRSVPSPREALAWSQRGWAVGRVSGARFVWRSNVGSPSVGWPGGVPRDTRCVDRPGGGCVGFVNSESVSARLQGLRQLPDRVLSRRKQRIQLAIASSSNGDACAAAASSRARSSRIATSTGDGSIAMLKWSQKVGTRAIWPLRDQRPDRVVFGMLSKGYRPLHHETK